MALRFYFDFISPYAYLGWTQIHALAARHGQDVEPVPVLFAAMLNAHGHKGPAEIAPKRAYVFKNTLRVAHGFGVPLVPPPSHPFNPLLALRVVSQPGGARRDLIDALFRATWATGAGVESRAQVAQVIRAVGLDSDSLLTQASTAAGKARLRTATAQAIERGVFGVPTVAVEDELFWGVDGFGHIEAFLAGEDPISPELVARWDNLPASASR